MPSFLQYLKEEIAPTKFDVSKLGKIPSEQTRNHIMQFFNNAEDLYAKTYLSDLPAQERFRRTVPSFFSQFGKVVHVDPSQLTLIEPTLSKTTIQNYGKTFDWSPNNKKLPQVYQIGNRMYVNDGNHRVASAKLAGLKEIPCVIVNLDQFFKQHK